MARKPRFNFTCRCRAYSFPHRLGGGQCTGVRWVSHYRQTCAALCNECNCLNGNTCEVETGQESIYECEAAIDVEHYGEA